MHVPVYALDYVIFNRLFKEIRERYFTITSSLALSNEPVSVCVSGSLTINSLQHIYDTLLNGLTNYWLVKI